MILRVIVSTLQVVEPRLGIIIISTISERIDLGQITLGRNYLAPRGVDVLCLQDTAFVNDLDNVTLQIENIVICIGSAAFRRVVERERAAGIIVEEVESRGIHRGRDSFADNLAVLRQVLMRHSLGRGKRPVGLRQILLLDIRLFRRSRVRLDRLPRLVLQRNKDQREQEFCLVQRELPFCSLWGGPAKDESFVFSSSASDSSISRTYNVSIHGFQDWLLPVERFLRRTPRLKKYIPTIIPATIKRIHKMEIHKLT